MFKKILMAAVVAFPMLAAAQTVKIGLVDTQAIVTEMPAFKAAQTEVAAKQQKLNEDGNKLYKEFQTKMEEFQNLPKDTPEATIQIRAKELENYQAKLNEFDQMAQQELTKAQNAALEPIMNQVQQAIQSVGAEGGYTLIQEKQAVLYYGAPAVDITAEVKARIK